MSETYSPIIQSPAYTMWLAERLGVPSDRLDFSQVISDDAAIRVHARREVRDAIKTSMFICGKHGRVVGPNYATRRLLPDRQKYGRVAGVLNMLYEDAAAEYQQHTGDHTQQKMYSVAFGEDGYVPKPGETVEDVRSWIDPQLQESLLSDSLAMIEATTSEWRFIGAGRSADTLGIKKINIGLSVDSGGALAADGTDPRKIIDRVADNPDRLDTEIELAVNCGSFSGTQKVFKRFPGIFKIVYPNANDIPDIRGLQAVGNGNGCAHHHGDPVTVDEVYEFAIREKPRVLGLCCGFHHTETADLANRFRRGRED